MKINCFLLLLILFVVSVVKGQVMIMDSISKLPIPAVSVFGEDGNLLAISDKDGRIDLVSSKLNKEVRLLVQHISYVPKAISVNEAFLEGIITLSAAAILIPEIEVSGVHNKDWLVLRGYFRNLETFYGRQKNFSDGLVTYYIPLLDQKARVKVRIEDYRIFGNKEVVAAFESFLGPFRDPPRVPILNKTSLDKRLPREYEIRAEERRRIFVKKGVEVGDMIFLPNGGIQSYIDFVRPDAVKRRTFLRLEGISKQQVQIETYYGENLSEVSMRQLKSFYRNVVGTIKRKKSAGRIPYETIDEFYVMERSYLSNTDIDKLKDSFSKSIYLEAKSDYKQKFWLDLGNFDIPPIPEGLAKQLGKELLLF